MNTLRQALQEYLAMRRSLGFKLQRAGSALLDFVSFLEQHRASYITLRLALAWAKQLKFPEIQHGSITLPCVTARPPRIYRGDWSVWGKPPRNPHSAQPRR